ncbi:MAG: lipoyl synthase [Planctomycetes bacterium]|nr:lipoyl synthase [Phycisphaerae bacterium]NBB95102.1 lipoyl synthase [Planctomycetota bacterium]
MIERSANTPRRRLPPWLKRRLPAGQAARRIKDVQAMLDELKLATVCNGAHCPNRGECYASGTATFLILGNTCTRACGFCAIDHRAPGPPRPDEPDAVAEAAHRMDLKYVVITSVTRDDLPDGGAGHFAATIQAVRQRRNEARIEVLVPDFQGSEAAIDTVLAARPDVFNHNVETVPRLYADVRPQADYAQSLAVLARAKQRAVQRATNTLTKSGLMVGVGERDEEVEAVLADLREVACDMLTIGQYLAPSDAHVPVARFVTPEQFDAWEAMAREKGFAAAACGPFVRSSYHAKEVFETGQSLTTAPTGPHTSARVERNPSGPPGRPLPKPDA